MTQRDTDLITSWQSFRKEHGRAPANDNEFDEYLKQIATVKREMER